MERLKKIGLVILFVAFAGGVGYMLFRFFFGGPAPETPPSEGELIVPGETTGGLPSAGEFVPGEIGGETGLPPGTLVPAAASPIAAGGLTATTSVETQSSIAPVLSPTGSLSYYNENDGKFYTIGPDGNPVLLSEKSFPAAENVTWSPMTDKAIIEFPDARKIIYDFEDDTQLTIPSHWEDFSFASDGESFAAKSMGLDPENRWLITVDANGSNARLVEHLGENADKVTVNVSPDNAVLALSDTGDPVGFDTHEIILIGQNDENYKALRVDGFNMMSQWSPDGEFLLYSASAAGDDYRPKLWFVRAKGDAIGENRTDLGLQTWADKCTFTDSYTLYCAVPDSLPVGIGLQPTLREDRSEVGTDTIYRVDLRTGRSTVVGRPENDTSISKIVVNEEKGLLFFQDQLSKEIRQMRLQ